ncbi:MAG: hypothetical protein N3D85_05485 [Candidatus Bathyarchaeota archaeon]|nr:hypothetical protein [Candidatus Bathyarchaeota archaeon]
MASVTVDDIRDVINVSSADIPDAKVLKMVKRAEVTLELELGREIDYNSCSDAEKEVLTVLAAIYVICYLSGGSFSGLNFNLGGKAVQVFDAKNVPSLEVLRGELARLLDRLKKPIVGYA